MNGKRKFVITLIITVSSIAGLFSGKIDQSVYSTLMMMILGIYGAANIVDKKLGGAG